MPRGERPAGDDVRAGDLKLEKEHPKDSQGSSPGDNDRANAEPPGQQVGREVLPLAEERLRVERRKIETGRVRVGTKVGVRQEALEVELTRDEVEVRRVPVGRRVEGPVQIRQEGDVTIVPVLEEVLVVSKQLILKEEVHISKRSSSRREAQTVDLRYEEPLVERLPAEEDPVEDRVGDDSE